MQSYYKNMIKWYHNKLHSFSLSRAVETANCRFVFQPKIPKASDAAFLSLFLLSRSLHANKPLCFYLLQVGRNSLIAVYEALFHGNRSPSFIGQTISSSLSKLQCFYITLSRVSLSHLLFRLRFFGFRPRLSIKQMYQSTPNLFRIEG